MSKQECDQLEIDFIDESNGIEGIIRPPTAAEIEEFKRFMDLDQPTVGDMRRFVDVYQPGAKLRDNPGMDVMIANRIPPRGGPYITGMLEDILDDAYDHPGATPFSIHTRYEGLHPFTDCNGRSGRMLWAWMHRDLRLGFLHRWYYQSLEANT